jgi:2-oxoglutarate dehydrogenase E2 component (dihydrolipoamide succinyltransferase)
MATDILVPTLGESVSTATVARWLKQAGEAVAADEPLVELETDKVTVEVNAPAAGVLEAIAVPQGAEVEPGTVLGSIAAGAAAAATVAFPARGTASAKPPGTGAGSIAASQDKATPPAPLPAAAKMMAENNLTAAQIGAGSAKDGRISKGDVLDFMSRPAAPPAAAAPRTERALDPGEERVKMTRLRATIARRLKEAQHNAAMLTTFNEVDMGAVMGLRAEYRDAFEKKHGVRLGFMSFFVKACVAALKEFPAVNAEIEGGDTVIYRNFVHMGIAVGGQIGRAHV